MSNVLAEPGPWDLVADGYAKFTMEGLAPYAAQALAIAGIGPQDHVLDVACGPGTLSFLAARAARRVTAVDFSKNMVAHFQKRLHAQKLANLDVQIGDGQALPFRDKTFDAAFSMFGLIFFPDRAKGFTELHRTLKPGGRAVVSSWASFTRSPLLSAMFGALRAMDPNAPEAPRSPGALEDPEVFQNEMEKAGFRDVQVVPVTKAFPYSSPEGFWEAMAAGSVPVVFLRREMGESAWKENEKRALAYLKKHWPIISRRLTSDAWLAAGHT